MQIITLPWFPKAASPNASRQGVWREKSEARKKYKATCMLECIAQKVQKMQGPIEAHYLFCPPSLHRQDLDNLLASVKAATDAVAERIGVDDADWHKITLQRGEKVARGQIVITLEEYRG